MKKYLLIILITTSFSGMANAQSVDLCWPMRALLNNYATHVMAGGGSNNINEAYQLALGDISYKFNSTTKKYAMKVIEYINEDWKAGMRYIDSKNYNNDCIKIQGGG